MACMINGKGPYPNKMGEFCGNFHPKSEKTLENKKQPDPRLHAHQKRSMMRFGKPSNCKAGTSAEMAAKGYVGLYLKEDRKLFDWETPIETDELTEEFVSREIP